MQKRSITAWVLVGYSAMLMTVVLFKGRMRWPDWAYPGQAVRVEGGRGGRARGPARGGGGAESRTGRPIAPNAPTVDGTRLSTNRFAPLHANYVPFQTILPQLRGRPRWSSAIINLVGNTLLFAPVGFLVRLIFGGMTWPQSLLLAVAVGVTLEVMEGVLRLGVVDIDDVILNALGVMSGYWLCRAWEHRRESALVRPT